MAESEISLINVEAVLANGTQPGATVVIDEGLITAVAGPNENASDRTYDLYGLKLFPGYIDVHIHGAVGADVNSADVDGLLSIAGYLAKNGVSAWMPTLVPDSDENYRQVITAIDRLMEVQAGLPVARAVGVHYEGVFANAKMCGALRPEYFKTFTGDEVAALPRLKSGVHMITIAPEIPGGIELVRELRRRSWLVSIGHTKAEISVLEQALAAGARHLTHFYNAMTGLHHRDVGAVGWALTNKDVTFDIIADGVHVHPKMLEFACRSKSPDNVTLISDSVAPAGLGEGEYEIWGEKVSVMKGRTQNERGSIAGSVITMSDAVKRMFSLGFSANEVSKMASLNPAGLLGIESDRGSIEVGKRADIVALNAAGELKLVIVGGRIVVNEIG